MVKNQKSGSLWRLKTCSWTGWRRRTTRILLVRWFQLLCWFYPHSLRDSCCCYWFFSLNVSEGWQVRWCWTDVSLWISWNPTNVQMWTEYVGCKQSKLTEHLKWLFPPHYFKVLSHHNAQIGSWQSLIMSKNTEYALRRVKNRYNLWYSDQFHLIFAFSLSF